MRLTLSVFLLTLPLAAAITEVEVDVTNTQAVIRYKAPDEQPCSVAVSEAQAMLPLVHDVNPALFAGSQFDNRSGSVTALRDRTFVAGRRSADPALDGKRYSRALQAATPHWYRIQCGADVFNGEFRTRSIPFGLTWNDPLPAAAGGDYAWPTVTWTDRTERIIDPHTGALLRRLTLPGDYVERFQASVGVPAATANWANPGALTADNGSATVYSGAGQEWLFVPSAVNLNPGGYHPRDGGSLNYINAEMNAWCGTGCAGAGVEDRKVEVCLTADGLQCASGILERTLNVCLANCTTDPAQRFTVGDTTPVLAAWGTVTFDVTDVHQRSGTVSTSGTRVNWAWGNYFSLRWSAGSRITINGAAYTIASVDNERQLTLTTSAGSQSGAAYSTSNFGFLIRKKSLGGQSVSVQWMRQNYGVGAAAVWDPGGDIETKVSCSPVLVSGPGGEQGYHCAVNKVIFWIGAKTGTAKRIGSAALAYRQHVDGWNTAYECPPMWDQTNGNVFYCQATNASGEKVIAKAVYTGSNEDIGPGNLYEMLVECGSPPCWTVTNLTPPSTGTLTNKLAAFSPDCAGTNPVLRIWALFGIQGNSLLLSVRAEDANDVLGCHVVFDLATNNIVAAKTSWKHYPTRWGVLHGSTSIGYDNLMFFPNQFAQGATSGTGTTGQGPWRSQITSGAIGTAGTACPARPGDSPIPAGEWPTGNNCLVVTVNGEPCDPSPSATELRNPSKCGVASQGYLMDAEVRDIFCIGDTADTRCNMTAYSLTEYVKLIVKNGTTWTLQRKLGTIGVTRSAPAGSYLIAMPPTCELNAVYPCANSATIWDFRADPSGTAEAAVLWDRLGNGNGHGTLRPGGSVWAAVENPGPTLDGQKYGYYDQRSGNLPQAYSRPSEYGTSNPPFAGRTGTGQPNEVESHPSQPHYRGETKTFLDARPFLGIDGGTGSPANPGVVVNGSLYKFSAGQVPRLRRKVLPTLAACGPHPLTDISSPATGNVIGGSSGDAYKYCVALRGGECRAGSQAGDVYANCPQVYFPHSNFIGVGSEDLEQRDITVTDNGAFTQGITQTYLDQPDVLGYRGRLITHALSRYRYTHIYWNVKATPLGEWLLVVAPWLAGTRSDAYLVKVPPAELDSQARNTFRDVTVEAVTPPPGATRLAAAFGYDENLRCTTRDERCIAASMDIQESNPFLWETELQPSSGTGLTGGSFRLSIPAIPGRVVYYRLLWRNGVTGQTVSTGPLQVAAVP